MFLPPTQSVVGHVRDGQIIAIMKARSRSWKATGHRPVFYNATSFGPEYALLPEWNTEHTRRDPRRRIMPATRWLFMSMGLSLLRSRFFQTTEPIQLTPHETASVCQLCAQFLSMILNPKHSRRD
jgi:hypothetical protein